MMARSKCSNQRPDTLMQDRSPPARRNHLQRAAGPYIRVKMRNTRCEQMSSALPPKPDIAQCSRHVRFVPERTHAAQQIAFLLDHIKSYVPAEDCAYRTVLKACAEGANTPNKLDDYLSKGVSPRDGSPFTNAFISTQRSGAISRMGDLGLVARKRDGIKVTYVTTETGDEYMTESVARTA